MESVLISPITGPKKTPAGIAGLDEIIGGGLPSGRTTLLVDRPGSGKTMLWRGSLLDEPWRREASRRIVDTFTHTDLALHALGFETAIA